MVGPKGKAVRRIMALTAVVVVMAVIESIRPAAAASWLEKNFWLSGPRYDAVLPPCESGWALDTIRSRFGTKESRFWNSDLAIVEFGQIRQIAFRPWAEATIPRRWCSGKVLVSDGRWRPVYYSIIEDGGMIGWKWGVEWCVAGLDRNWAYNPNCKMARP
jgi:hypothetical protein